MPDRYPALFKAFGIELEYMIVDADTLDVLPVADRLLRDPSGRVVGELDRGEFCWSNELVAHVVELKVSPPAARLEGLDQRLLLEIGEINARLREQQACLMPGGMHPWMNPERETVLWPHDGAEIYNAFHRAFDCRGHGWSNLQSAHLNLPFQNDAEFGRLHAAVRMILPVVPALAASSPVVEGRPTGPLDNRLAVYMTNCQRVPLATGRVIPEAVFTQQEYQRRILEPLYQQMLPHDPGGVLQHEWLNARGAIARFTRQSIELRLLDVQECPLADLAIAAALVGVLKSLVDERFSSFEMQKSFHEAPLAAILRAVLTDADEAIIDDPSYLGAFGLGAPQTAAQLWRHLLEQAQSWHPLDPAWRAPLEVILGEGPLARRILRALAAAPPHESNPLKAVYRRLCQCLARGQMLRCEA